MGGRRVEWAQEEEDDDDEGELKAGPPRGTAGSKGALSRSGPGRLCTLAVLLAWCIWDGERDEEGGEGELWWTSASTAHKNCYLHLPTLFFPCFFFFSCSVSVCVTTQMCQTFCTCLQHHNHICRSDYCLVSQEFTIQDLGKVLL